MTEEAIEQERDRQRRKNAGYFMVRLQRLKDRWLIDWLLNGRQKGERRGKAIKRKLYQLMNRDLGRE